MYKSKINYHREAPPDVVDIKLKILQNGRLATSLFMLGCFLNFVEYNYSEKAISQSMNNPSENSLTFDNEVKAAIIAETVSIIFLIAISIFTANAITTFTLNLNNFNPDPSQDSKINSNSNNSSKIIAFFDIIKVLGYLGAAVGYSSTLDELKSSKN
ncbi:hypothetical protein [Paraclostridium sordellii]|uniref:hypothetical protein n=2 Tax=Paraclostridium sordellii TaxID=1505 RepID=UPI0005E65679|nr:hypothetical protein [Paeniclostridium sordellii]CEO13265.1 Uncharacterised protein [[Clostridium] sordellii] [Paeniclostridium sordellii]CEP89099.1 Uncharacterised protein [[Clostridium] sordellii] [Paeniclostridium sordellii]CEP97863.1 Uncharacterised protein [[Clostridium] sordellii] [Paeniclostridium sordellii]CEQ01252.1 Uncharacterised protein [[Clostridium] sordellii] [Paeniclostridium sordellii]